uniref:Uncharacterized protein n=1 Tax=Vespula pensylvanica TaxID=30213 RepID=A0A834K4H4_VESPE|nr:hypothetical protein H0235_016257 [Vespula pensylvanica]
MTIEIRHEEIIPSCLSPFILYLSSSKMHSKSFHCYSAGARNCISLAIAQQSYRALLYEQEVATFDLSSLEVVPKRCAADV